MIPASLRFSARAGLLLCALLATPCCSSEDDGGSPATSGGTPSRGGSSTAGAPGGAGSEPGSTGGAGDAGASANDGSAGAPEEGSAGAGDDGAPWRPAPGTSWQWQLTGTIDTSVEVQMFDIDLFDAPQATIDELRDAGRTVICYFSAGSSEDWRPDFSAFEEADKGAPLDDWPGELWIDVRSINVRELMTARLDLAVEKHCDGVEPDNVDGYANDNGLGLTEQDQLDYLHFLASEAHGRGLSIGLKNSLDLIDALVGEFDWALDEECFLYDECALLAPFIEQDKAVFHVEYGDESLLDSVCGDPSTQGFSTLIKNLDLDAWRAPCP
ncbi:MAG TPA: endo alpha-1,4 polygalactosaminidase [Polyangiaceae bacterium]|nr:endo alpha-1,4 polygalactosaminidase [Polyangiaceae bacterium]